MAAQQIVTSSAEEVVISEPPVGEGTPIRDPARISKLDTENKNVNKTNFPSTKYLFSLSK